MVNMVSIHTFGTTCKLPWYAYLVSSMLLNMVLSKYTYLRNDTMRRADCPQLLERHGVQVGRETIGADSRRPGLCVGVGLGGVG